MRDSLFFITRCFILCVECRLCLEMEEVKEEDFKDRETDRRTERRIERSFIQLNRC